MGKRPIITVFPDYGSALRCPHDRSEKRLRATRVDLKRFLSESAWPNSSAWVQIGRKILRIP